MTSLKAAFEASSVTQAENDLRIAISKFLNHGGSCERLIAICNEAVAAMPREGQAAYARSGRQPDADARQPIASGAGPAPAASSGQRGFTGPARELIPDEGDLSLHPRGTGVTALRLLRTVTDVRGYLERRGDRIRKRGAE